MGSGLKGRLAGVSMDVLETDLARVDRDTGTWRSSWKIQHTATQWSKNHAQLITAQGLCNDDEVMTSCWLSNSKHSCGAATGTSSPKLNAAASDDTNQCPQSLPDRRYAFVKHGAQPGEHQNCRCPTSAAL